MFILNLIFFFEKIIIKKLFKKFIFNITETIYNFLIKNK